MPLQKYIFRVQMTLFQFINVTLQKCLRISAMVSKDMQWYMLLTQLVPKNVYWVLILQEAFTIVSFETIADILGRF